MSLTNSLRTYCLLFGYFFLLADILLLAFDALAFMDGGLQGLARDWVRATVPTASNAAKEMMLKLAKGILITGNME